MIGAMIAKSKARSAFDCLNRRDFPAFLAAWAEDATFVYPSNVSVGGEIKGKKAVEEWFQRFREQYPKVNFTLKNVFVADVFAFGATNVVAVEWDIAVTNREGRDFQNSGVTTIQVKNGKATLVRDYIYDTETLKRAWGEKQV